MSGSHFARFAELGTTMSPDILAICLFAGLEWQLASRMCILTHHRLLAATAFQGEVRALSLSFPREKSGLKVKSRIIWI